MHATYNHFVIRLDGGNVTTCEDTIPTTCNYPPPIDTCPEIIEFATTLGIDLECLCDTEWKNVKGNQFFTSNCAPTTPGRYRDNCKVSCKVCEKPGKSVVLLRERSYISR